MSLEFITKYLPLYEKAAWLTVKIGFAGVLLSIVIGLFTVRGHPVLQDSCFNRINGSIYRT